MPASFDDFTYRSGSTTVSTQVARFSRPAKGYVRTSPGWRSPACGPTVWRPATCPVIWPPTRRRERNAWSASTPPTPGRAVWTPQNQWLGLDPTNDQMVDERYIVVGWGRDYADVPPLRGIIYTDSEKQRDRRRRSTWRRSKGESSMRDFLCPNCGQHLTFENSVCLSCGSRSGSRCDEMALLVIASGEDSEHGGAVDASRVPAVRESACGRMQLAGQGGRTIRRPSCAPRAG